MQELQCQDDYLPKEFNLIITLKKKKKVFDSEWETIIESNETRLLN